jgi:hypothetical protein
MPDNFFTIEKISMKYLITIGICFCISLSFFFLYKFNQNSKDYRDLVDFYNTGGAIAMYLFFYKALRNLYVFLLFFFLGVLHFLFYLKIQGDPTLFRNHYDLANCFRNTILFVIFFQVLRFISFQIQYQDLIAPSKFDLAFDDDRKATPTDIILFVIHIIFVFVITLN